MKQNKFIKQALEYFFYTSSVVLQIQRNLVAEPFRHFIIQREAFAFLQYVFLPFK